MDSKWKILAKALWVLIIYLIVFWVGFRTGEIYNRMRFKAEVKKIEIPKPTEPRKKEYLVIEKIKNREKEVVHFRRVDESHVFIRMYKNNKLKKLLGLKDLQIYTFDGKRIY